MAHFLQIPRSRSTDPRDANRVERVLAAGRVILAVGTFIAAYFDFAERLRHPSLTYSLLAAYIIYSATILTTAQVRPLARIRAGLHLFDLAWVALFSAVTAELGSPFFVFFTFLLLAAGWRWGLMETMATGVAIAAIFGAQTLLFGITGYLLLATLFVGLIAETEKRVREEKALITTALSKVRADVGVTQSAQGILDEIRSFYDAARVVVIVEELQSGKLFYAARNNGTASDSLAFAQIEKEKKAAYLFPSGADTWRCRLKQRSGQCETSGIDASANVVESAVAAPPEIFCNSLPCRSFLATTVSFGGELAGRLYIFDAKRDTGKLDQLAFLQRMVRPISSALYNVYLWRRLRAKVGELERARVARELHDGVIQSLIGLEMQLDVLKRQSNAGAGTAFGDISRVQDLLRKEIQNVRMLMKEMRPPAICPDDMVAVMADMVEKFSRSTAIATTFRSGREDVSLPAQVCRELVQILQEALTNIKKHSDARHVAVRFDSSQESWQLSIEDDGRGFDFEGNLTQDQLDRRHAGPVVIKERVRLIQGSLEIESHPGKGSRLKIHLLKHIYA